MHRFLADVENGRLKRDELLTTYFSLVYAMCGSFRATAKQLGTDWRTVQRLLDMKRVGDFTDTSKPGSVR